MQNIGAINKYCKNIALQFAIILQYYCTIFYIAINIGAKGIIAIFCNNIGPTPAPGPKSFASECTYLDLVKMNK